MSMLQQAMCWRPQRAGLCGPALCCHAEPVAVANAVPGQVLDGAFDAHGFTTMQGTGLGESGGGLFAAQVPEKPCNLLQNLRITLTFFRTLASRVQGDALDGRMQRFAVDR
jgi:hypothetical protein